MESSTSNSKERAAPVATLVERATHLVGSYLGPTMASLGITQAEAHVLAQLDRGGSTSIGALHHEFGTKRSTLTNVLDRLEGRKLIRRELNPSDRRSFVVGLTGSGRRAARTVSQALDRLDHELAASIAARDLDALDRIVRQLELIVNKNV
jgi:DNA-binding MarR family transcriptional regulator